MSFSPTSSTSSTDNVDTAKTSASAESSAPASASAGAFRSSSALHADTDDDNDNDNDGGDNDSDGDGDVNMGDEDEDDDNENENGGGGGGGDGNKENASGSSSSMSGGNNHKNNINGEHKNNTNTDAANNASGENTHNNNNNSKDKKIDGQINGKSKNNTTNTSGDNSNSNSNKSSTSSTPATAAAAPEVALPVLKGTLTYLNNELTRKHIIRGMWNFEPQNLSTQQHKPQRFELVRTLGPDEDPTELPKDGVFHGSFSLAYVHVSAKGKKKEKSKVITESGVKIKFTERMNDEDDDDGYDDDDDDSNSNGNRNRSLETFDVNGEGTNQYGVFSVTGTAVRDPDGPDKSFQVELRKRYLTSPSTSASANMNGSADGSATPNKKKSKGKKRKLDKTLGNGGGGSGSGGNGSAIEGNGLKAMGPTEPLPPPSTPHPSGVVSLRGTITPTSSAQDGVIHTVSGMWSSGLDIILSDPENKRGLCNPFEYEYRGTVSTGAYPISGKYTGWFNLTGEDGMRNRIPERDVTLRFKPNNEGFWNVEGRGSNMFGKYNITGTLGKDRVITIFRHFLPVKQKKVVNSNVSDLAALGGGNKDARLVLPPDSVDENRMTLDDVIVQSSEDGDIVKPLVAPEDGQYAALSRGILKVNNDGAITCTGKWAITRTHYTNNIASNFHFGLESHHAKQGAGEMKAKGIGSHSGHGGDGAPTATCFPVDSANYKGSFKMKRGAAKLQSVVDRQIVMKFRKNKQGSYNVYGKGVNTFGTFDLVGTLILQGKESGHVELYRIYVPEPTPEPAPAGSTSSSSTSHNLPGTSAGTGTGKHLGKTGKALPTAKNSSKKGGQSKAPSAFSSIPSAPAGGMFRRESSRATKLPSRLEEDDPHAMNSRLMEKCAAVLKFMQEKDALGGRFFAEPVDPVAHGIPTYHQIITNPMDLGTIQAKMDANEVETPEQFARLVRLIFENAIKFNVESSHIVHQGARNLLTIFNNKFRDVERLMEKKKKPTKKELKEQKKRQQDEQKRLEKERTKRKREEEEDPTLKKIRLMHSSSQEVANNLIALKAASASALQANVSRDEFNLQTSILQHLSTQVCQIQGLVATLIPRAASSGPTPVAQDSLSNASMLSETTAPKKSAKRKKTASKTDKQAASASTAAPPYRAPSPVPSPAPAPVARNMDDVPLTLEEQQELTTAINTIVDTMSEEKLTTVINIIKESANLNDDEDEIDLEIDQLSTATQRKLLNFVNQVSIYACCKAQNNFFFNLNPAAISQ